MAAPRVLIAGAGIAGSVLAYWLGKGGARVTVVERAPAIRTTGQPIEIEGAALEIVRHMGLEDKIRAKVSGEKGLAMVDTDNNIVAAFDIGDKQTDIGLVSELEIMRGDLVDILYRAAKEFANVEFRFSTSDPGFRSICSQSIVRRHR